jgi:multiple sugar transport system permease protein
MGTVAPAEKRRRDLVAWIVVIGSLMLFVFLGKYTLNAYGQALATPGQVTKASTRRLLIALLTLLPAVAAIVLFQYYPLARGSLIAFKDYHLLTPSPWVGVSNFGQVLFSADFWKALLRSLEFAVISMALGFFAPIMLALMLHEIPRGSLFFRIVYFLPSVTTGIVVMLLWKQFYDPSSYGMLNQLLGFFHLPLQTFLQDPNLVMVWVVLPSVWMGLGPGCIIYLACLRQIPDEYYEAADVDGAGFWTKLWVITVPFIKPLLIINFVGACIGSLKSFEQVMVMTGGGPAGSSRVLGLEIWQNSFMYLRYGYGTAMGWILASLLIGFTIFQLRYLSKVQFRLAKSE